MLTHDDLARHARAEWVACAEGQAGPYRAWTTPAPAWCLLVDHSGSMAGRALATAGLAAAAIAARADAANLAVLSFARSVVAVSALADRHDPGQVVDRVLALRGQPFLAALAVLGLTEGRAGVVGLLRRMVRWRVGVGWYAVALLLPAANPVGARRLAERLCTDIADIDAGDGHSPAVVLHARSGVAAPSIQAGMHFDALFGAAGPAVADAPSRQPAPEPPAPPPDLETALALIERGSIDRLGPHLDHLVRRTVPLLELWNRNTGGRLDALLQQLNVPAEH